MVKRPFSRIGSVMIVSIPEQSIFRSPKFYYGNTDSSLVASMCTLERDNLDLEREYTLFS